MRRLSSAVIKKQGAHLPHWTREGGIYSVTFRLADSVPRSQLEKWLWERKDIVRTAQYVERELSEEEKRRLIQLHSEKIEKFLDAGHGACCMKHDDVAAVVASAFRYFDGKRYTLHAWCVMPNHVHVVFQPFSKWTVPRILHSWKSFTAKEANRILSRTGTFWQAEYHDYLVRDDDDLLRCIEYVWENPEKAGLLNWRWRWRIPGL